MNNISFKIANTKELLLQSYQLVYKRYVDVGFCQKNENQIYFGFHDLLIDTRTFVAEIDGKVIATLSVIIDNSAGLPCEHLFKNEVNSFRDSNKKIAEISRFAVSQDFKKNSVVIFQYLFQLLYHSYVSSSNVTDCIIMVEPRHCKVYKKFGFNEISDIKLDHDADNAESKLMRLKLKENESIVHYPCFDKALNELKGFLPVLNESLIKNQELYSMYKKFLSHNSFFTEEEFKLYNFRNFLINSYLHKTKLKKSNVKLVDKLKPSDHLANEMYLSHVS